MTDTPFTPAGASSALSIEQPLVLLNTPPAALTLSPTTPGFVFATVPAAAGLALSIETPFIGTPGAALVLTGTLPFLGTPTAALSLSTAPPVLGKIYTPPGAMSLATSSAAPKISFAQVSLIATLVGTTPTVLSALGKTPPAASLSVTTFVPPVVSAFGFPPYPRLPEAGSNASGIGVTGVSPTGDLPLLTLWDVIISQYANSPIITAWMSSWFSALDPTEFFDSFFDNLWNIETATGYGIDVWGRIVGGLKFTRNIPVVSPIPYVSCDDPNLGCDMPGVDIYTPGDPLTQIIPQAMEEEDWRRLVLARAASNISDGSISSVLFSYNVFFRWYGSQVFIDEANQQQSGLAYTLVVASNPPSSLLNLTIITNNLITTNSTGADMQILVASKPGGPIAGLDRNDSVISGCDIGVLAVTPAQFIAFSQ